MAGRLALWFATSASLLVLTAAVSMDRLIARSMAEEADRFLEYSVYFFHKNAGEIASLSGDLIDWNADHLRVLDADGRVIFASPEAARILPPPLPTAGEAGVDHLCSDGRWLRILCRRIDGRLYQVAFDRSRDFQTLATFRRSLLPALGPALGLSVLVGWFIARRGTRPVGKIAATAERIGPGRLGERIELDGLPDELRGLASTFNGMLDRLQDSFVRLDRFSADIAHELRTPVHRFRNVAEVALSLDRSPLRDAEALGVCLDAGENLCELIDRLLFLARAEDPRRQLNREEVEIGHELMVVREFFEAIAAEGGVDLLVEAPPGLRFVVDRQLLRRAIGNLVMNALAHTPPGGSVAIRAFGTQEGLCICVADTGRGISAEHLPHLFDRFYRPEAARTPGQGVGLGLAIVKSITELHGGRTEVVSEPGRGSTFTLVLAHQSLMTTMSSS